MRYWAFTVLISCLTLLSGPSARAQAHIEFIDTGTPKNGAVVMTGWHGVIVRVVLDDGSPITRISFGDNSFGGYIAGNIAQRWTDPTGQGHYTVTSPGPMTANNSFDSDFNFDSHFLGSPVMYTATSVTEYDAHDFLTFRTGLTSDGDVGYGASSFVPYYIDPIVFTEGGLLRGTLDVDPASAASSLAAAYVVTDSAFQVDALVLDGTGGVASGVFEVPEPSGALLSLFAGVMALFCRRPRARRGTRPFQIAAFERLENRLQLAVIAPTHVAAVMELDGSAVVSWEDMGTGISYTVDRSPDGISSWQTVTNSPLDPGTTQFTNPRLDATPALYRVTAIQGADSATSTAAKESVPPGILAPAFEAEAEPLSLGVRLSWELNPSLGTQMFIYRKGVGDPLWPITALATVPVASSDGYYDDSTVGAGTAFEYRLRFASQEKFIYAGNAKSASSSNGIALLVVDEPLFDGTGTSLQSAISGFTADLVGDGYQVLTRTVPRVDVPQALPPDESPATISSFFGPWKTAVHATKLAIREVWAEYGATLTNVVLIGHVPVPYSGLTPADVHGDHRGAWPADIYYATLNTSDDIWTDVMPKVPNSVYPANANYPGDGKFDQDYSGAIADVAIGRIDFARTGWGVSLDVGSQPTDTEVAELQTYFAKDHAYRTGQWDVKHQALIDRNLPFAGGFFDPTRLSANVGDDAVKNGTVSAIGADHADHDANNDSWLWTYAVGPGARYAIPGGGFSQDDILLDYADGRGLYGNDFLLAGSGKHQSVFNLFFGSYIGDWDGSNPLLRTPLGEADGYGLAVGWGARPTWDVHRMGLGGTIGQSLVLTQNDRGTYTADSTYDGSVDTSLMGDPTLRQDAVKPVSNITALSDPGGNVITWTASTEPGIDGYYIYRSADPNGTWTLCNASAVSSTTYTDTAATSVDGYYYMVRADKLTTTPSGSYYTLSVGQVSQPVFVNKAAAFDWDGHVPTADNPWKQWIDLQFSQDLLFPDDPSSWLTISGQLWQSGGTFTPKTLVYNADYKLVDDPAARTRRIVFLNPATQAADFAPNGIWTLTLSGSLASAFGRPLVIDDRTLAFNFLIADANNDAKVDFTDLVIVSQHYNQSDPSGDSPRPWGDLNGDGIVNFDDLVLVSQYYDANLLA